MKNYLVSAIVSTYNSERFMRGLLVRRRADDDGGECRRHAANGLIGIVVLAAADEGVAQRLVLVVGHDPTLPPFVGTATSDAGRGK